MTTRIAYEKRGLDDWGSGAFGASRGSKVHRGRDYLRQPGEAVRAPMEGRVVRIGYPYPNNMHFKLIEVLSGSILWRIFYVKPCVVKGEFVTEGKILGHAQDISGKYVRSTRGPMGNHIHVECIVDPEAFFDSLKPTNRGGALWV